MVRMLRFVAAGIAALAVLTLGLWARYIRMPPVRVPELSGSVLRDSIVVDGRQRSFLYYLPRHLPRDPALLLVLHGSGGSGAPMRRMTGHAFDDLAEREGTIVVYPDAWDRNWNDCRAAGDYEARRLGVNDVAFTRTLVDRFRRERGVPPGRVFAAGFSNGGQLAYRLALEAPELVRAVAVMAASMPATTAPRCRASGRGVPVLIMNGTDDPLNPYEGGEVALWGFLHRRGQVQSSLASARYWAALGGHMGEPVREAIVDADPADGTTATRLSWAGTAGPEVVLVSVEGGGHAIPHPHVSGPRLLGRTSHDFSAAEEIWRFFRPYADPANAGR